MIGAPTGTVVATSGGLVKALLRGLGIGAGVRILSGGARVVPGRVTAVDGDQLTLAPFGGLEGVAAGDHVEADPGALDVPLGVACLGRMMDALGLPLDGRPAIVGCRGTVGGGSHAPVDRLGISTPFSTGVRAIDGPLAFGAGARIGIFGAPGCGKSTLLEAIVAGSSADVTVVGLVGERGREAQRWMNHLDPRTTIVCATGDRSAPERLRAAEVAFAQAEALRRRGLDVLLVLDSLARIAAAARDVAVAAGEAVGRGGFPPSVFSVLTGLLERAGRFRVGSITLIATVLSDGPDLHDPVSEACRAALDGHVVLSERLARAGWFPAIDVPASASRTLADVACAEHLTAARAVRLALARLDETREARGFGLEPGAGDPVLRRAIAAEGAIAGFLRQTEAATPSATLTELTALTDRLGDGYSR